MRLSFRLEGDGMIALLITVLLFICLYVTMRSRYFFFGIILGFFSLISLVVTGFELLALISDRGPTFEYLVLAFVYGFIPLIFLIGIGYLVYNTQIMHSKEGKSFTAKLSMLLGVNLLIAFPLFFLLVSGALRLPDLLSTLLITLSLLDIIFTLLFIGYLIYSALYQLIPVRKTVNYIIILGAGVRSEEVTPLLRSRLDKALQYQAKQKEKIKFVVSGGQGPDEPVSEAFTMRKYLLSQGVPKEQIIFEDQSTTTLENLTFSKKLIEADWQEEKEPVILFSTSNYHVLRGAMYTRKAKIKAEGIGAPVAFYFLPTALIREFVALLVKYKWFTLSVILLVIAFIIVSSMPFNIKANV